MKQHIENLKHPPGIPTIKATFDLNISPTFPNFYGGGDQELPNVAKILTLRRSSFKMK